ncbi:MAG: aromatic ring-hydroxylating dioxygenase subunit alpha [Rhodanobacteraceae bacterium]|nr:aromatic ring-hydroxylating dioxygenase subunit alpha [Rhodanobacteraceae bacterium]
MPFRPDPAWLAPQPLLSASALPAPFYTDADATAQERSRVFVPGWQLVTSAQQLAESGDHVVDEIAGVPVLLVRGDDGELRGFHNVCRHRAGPLAWCSGRGARVLRCRYHGWTYALDGRLRGAAEMDSAQDFDTANVHLPAVAVGVWQGLVFASLAPAMALDDLLAGIAARLAGHDLAALVFSHRDSYEIACNWKVYVDNYLEGYHVPHIHPELNRLLDYRSYRTEVADWHSLQWSPLENSGNFYGSGDALYYFVWPNTMLNVLPGRLQTNRVVPLAADRCRVDFDYYYPARVDAAEQERRRQDRQFSDAVQKEDVDICLAVQKRLASGSYLAGRLCPRRESGVHLFHELLRRAWRED